MGFQGVKVAICLDQDGHCHPVQGHHLWAANTGCRRSACDVKSEEEYMLLSPYLTHLGRKGTSALSGGRWKVPLIVIVLNLEPSWDRRHSLELCGGVQKVVAGCWLIDWLIDSFIHSLRTQPLPGATSWGNRSKTSESTRGAGLISSHHPLSATLEGEHLLTGNPFLKVAEWKGKQAV